MSQDTTNPIPFSNPRTHAVIEDYPLGGNRRGQAIYRVESHPKKGDRIGRVTVGKEKFSTYGDKAAIVDGRNGRTYLLFLHGEGLGYRAVRIVSSDLQHIPSQREESELGIAKHHFYSQYPEDRPLYDELARLIENRVENRPEQASR